MSAATSASLCWILLSVCLLSVSADQKNIIAVPGQTVTLPCRAPNNNYPVLVVEWSRADLETEYVLFYRDEKLDPEAQHPSFKNRVDLQDRQMKDGDASLVLNNVTTADNGTYECCVVQEVRDGRRSIFFKSEPISIIHLKVLSPGPSGGDTEEGGKRDGFIGLLGFLVLSFVSCVILIKYMKKTERTEKAEAEKSSTPLPSSKMKRSVRPSRSIFRGRKTDVVKTDRSSH